MGVNEFGQLLGVVPEDGDNKCLMVDFEEIIS
jgi:hypothetical protein